MHVLEHVIGKKRKRKIVIIKKFFPTVKMFVFLNYEITLIEP